MPRKRRKRRKPKVKTVGAKITVAGQDFLRNSEAYVRKGDVIAVVPEGGDWGRREVPPNFVRVEIIDESTQKVLNFTQGWRIEYDFVELEDKPAGWRYRVEVDPAWISASGIGKNAMREEMVTYIEGYTEPGTLWYGCVVVGFTSSSMTVDIPKNGLFQLEQGLTDIEYLKELKADFNDVFKFILNLRRYYFSEDDVDTGLAQPGGHVVITKEQALGKVLDKLDL